MEAAGGPWIPAVTLSLVLGLLSLLYILRRRCFTAFEGTGIPGPEPDSLILGNWTSYWKPNVEVNLSRWAKEYGDVFGFYLGDSPFVVIKKPDLIRDILIKDFENFTERGVLMRIHELHPLLKDNLIFSKDDKWKSTRCYITKAFTPAKLKTMMPALKDAVQQFLTNLGKAVDSREEIDMTVQTAALTFDVVSKTAFGVITNVQKNAAPPIFKAALACFPTMMDGTFYYLSQSLYQWPLVLRPLLAAVRILPFNPLVKMLDNVREVVELRKKSPEVKRPDLMESLLEAKVVSLDGNKEESMSSTEIAANSTAIFLGGYDTTRLTLSYWFYLMATHPDVQEKMRSEVVQAAEADGGDLSYQTVMSLPYTNQVLFETMRMYPPVNTFTTRRAQEDYIWGDIVIKKGMSVMIPTYQIHHDPILWSEPEAFRPERFAPENKDSIAATSYIPFGVGPRNCVGQRFAMLELAFVVSQVLRHYRIALGARQKNKLELSTYAFVLVPKDGVWIELQRLDHSK